MKQRTRATRERAGYGTSCLSPMAAACGDSASGRLARRMGFLAGDPAMILRWILVLGARERRAGHGATRAGWGWGWVRGWGGDFGGETWDVTASGRT
ncbi:MAG: hypothetical protein ACK55I_06370, partial [bacterium]